MTRDTRYNAQGALLCRAKRSDGNACNAPAMRGQLVCRTHGGSAPQAKRSARVRLAALVDPAVQTLAREMANQSNASRDKQAAANSVLDRAGYGRASKIEGEDARDILLERMRRLQESEQEDNEGDE